MIAIEVAYATPAHQMIIPLQVELSTTARQAIELSNILWHFPEIELSKTKIGIFSQLCELNTVLKAGDRVEIYRPLLCDPKQARRDRAVK
jgi:putative ubiquitin-RnfH superfamily antitoxin RatB of RatAB toxin-antitoxin module